MKRAIGVAAALAASTTLASAGNLDRSGQSIAPLFEDGTYAELRFGLVSPDVSGVDNPEFGGLASGDVASSYLNIGLAYKRDFTDQLSFALLIDEPYGVDVTYPLGGSIAFGGTRAVLDTRTVTGILRYDFGNRFSVHGGVKAQQLSGDVTLSGAAYGALSGYNSSFSNDVGYGYLLGASYEIPDIALRVSLTYHSEVDHSPDTQENFAPGVVSSTDITTPSAWNLDFQTGIAEDTLLFGGIRWVDYSVVDVTPQTFGAVTPPGTSLVTIDDDITFTLGVGRRFTPDFSAALSLTYEPSRNELVSPLGPTEGRLGLTLAGSYKIGQATVTGGINYTDLGDALPRTAGVARASFTGNKALGVGVRLGYNF